MPGDDPAREPPSREPDDALGQRLRADPAEQPAEAHVGAYQTELAVDV
jgi:hypothetical protein